MQRISTPQEKDVSEQKDVEVRGRLLGRLYSGLGFLRDFLGRSWFRLVFDLPSLPYIRLLLSGAVVY